MTEWIKCSEIPPPEDGDFLLWNGDYFGIGTLLYLDEDKDNMPVFIVGNTTFVPTHWAELPEVPHD